MSGQSDFKEGRRHKADIDEWKILRKLKLGICRVCLMGSEDPNAWKWGDELHHLLGRDLGGDDLPENLVPLCRDHHRDVEERDPVACELLGESLTPKEIAYVLRKKGARFLDRYYYPRRSAEDVGTAA